MEQNPPIRGLNPIKAQKQLRKTENNFWVEMSIREIWTQCHFSERAFSNLDPKSSRNSDVVFSSIHSFLSHCAMVSKLLKATASRKSAITIGKVLGVSKTSVIHKRKFRNCLEHYHNELKKWIRKKGVNVMIGTYNIGPKSAFNIHKMVFVNHYDPASKTFTFVDEDLDLGILHKEIQTIKNTAGAWVKEVESGTRKTPYIS
jgi:hypothetical protein